MLYLTLFVFPTYDTHYFHVMVFILLVLLNPLSTNPTKWSNTLKRFVGKLPTNCLSVFDHFVKLALKGLRKGVKERIRLFDVHVILTLFL